MRSFLCFLLISFGLTTLFFTPVSADLLDKGRRLLPITSSLRRQARADLNNLRLLQELVKSDDQANKDNEDKPAAKKEEEKPKAEEKPNADDEKVEDKKEDEEEKPKPKEEEKPKPKEEKPKEEEKPTVVVPAIDLTQEVNCPNIGFFTGEDTKKPRNIISNNTGVCNYLQESCCSTDELKTLKEWWEGIAGSRKSRQRKRLEQAEDIALFTVAIIKLHGELSTVASWLIEKSNLPDKSYCKEKSIHLQAHKAANMAPY